ncbi:MAG: DUF3667 domain-containing protein [Burkholderiaceae bacterium]|nr:DUF3667 domain-containing protein [Burkholderiaceae bacterium]
MVGESDAIGQLADAALIGAALERGGEAQGHDEKCANCGTQLSGAYCQKCGQRGHVHRSLLHLLEEVFHGMLHLDGKIWRTAPLLLFRPGALTRRYVEGERVRFLSPVGFFLFSIFLMFFAVAHIEMKDIGPVPDEFTADQKAKTADALTQAEQDLEKRNMTPEKLAAARAEIEKAKQALNSPDSAGDEDNPFSKPFGFDWRALSKKLANSKTFHTSIGDAAMEQKVRASLADPDLLVFKMRSAASEYSFLLVPLSVPFLWLMFFWRRRVYLFDHVIFSLHSLSFMALFTCALVVGIKAHVNWLWGSWLFFVPPLHMFFHLKGAYRLGIFGAFWRMSLLSIIAIIVLCTYLIAILVLGLVD